MPFSDVVVWFFASTLSSDETATPSITCVEDRLRFPVEATRTAAFTATDVVRPFNLSVCVDGIYGPSRILFDKPFDRSLAQGRVVEFLPIFGLAFQCLGDRFGDAQ